MSNPGPGRPKTIHAVKRLDVPITERQAEGLRAYRRDHGIATDTEAVRRLLEEYADLSESKETQ